MKHHFLPVFYLRGFTSSYPKKKGHLFEFNLQECRQRGPCRPEDLAFVDDLYKSEVGLGENRYEVEEFWNSHVENHVAPVMYSIFRSGKLPDDHGRAYLLHFVASMAVRSPTIREFIEAFVNRTFRDSLLAETVMPDTFEQLVARTPIVVPPNLMERVRIEMRRDLLEGRMSNNVFLNGSLTQMLDLCRFLGDRSLQLRICEDSAPNLVCPDWPIRFMPNPDMPRNADAAGHLRDSTLIFRLNRRMALFVIPRGPELTGKLSTLEALMINRIAVLSCFGARRFIYSTDEEFCFMGDGGVQWRRNELVDYLSRRRAS